MATWKKSFRSMPSILTAKIEDRDTNIIEVAAGKEISKADILGGLYAHIGLSRERMSVGDTWTMMPDGSAGRKSSENLNGRDVTRKDLPKFKKYSYHDIAPYGDAAKNGYKTVAIPRNVYPHEFIPPQHLSIEVHIQEELPNDKLGVVFKINESFDRNSLTFAEDIFFAVNLMQENTGVSDIRSAADPDIIFSSALNWEVFPAGDFDSVVTSVLSGRGSSLNPDTVTERLRMFQEYQPIQFLRGMGGDDRYIGAKYSDDFVVFENMKYGNALYALYGDWETLSQLPRSQLLRRMSDEYDRIIHSAGWHHVFRELMNVELAARGLRRKTRSRPRRQK
jgi:hypothetical protein